MIFTIIFNYFFSPNLIKFSLFGLIYPIFCSRFLNRLQSFDILLFPDADTDRSVWWHFLIVHVPDEFDPDIGHNGYVLIDGGDNDNPEQLPDHSDNFVALTGLMADATKT